MEGCITMDVKMKRLNLGREGVLLKDLTDKIGIYDADSIAYAICVTEEYEIAEDEWDINLEDAIDTAIKRVEEYAKSCGIKLENIELHFTKGRESFRYKLLEDAFPEYPEMQYKFKRKKKRYPVGLKEVREGMAKQFKSFFHTEVEADDMVVYRKKQLGDDSILIAKDKDVLKNVPGTHYNYHHSVLYDKHPHFVTVTEDEAMFHQYLQAIKGDRSDNIPGLPGIGEVKAGKFIVDGMNEEELITGVFQAFRTHSKRKDIEPDDFARLNIRLVNMHQLTDKGVVLWNKK